MMKAPHIALYFAIAGLVSACVYVPPKEGTARRVSPDYLATGDVHDARAFIYGNKYTLLTFANTSPVMLAIRDVNGNSVSYEKTGRYFRLPRVLDTFTVWVNGRSVTFISPITTTHVFSAPSAKISAHAPVTVKVVQTKSAPATNPGDQDVAALLKLCEVQLAEVRHQLDKVNQNPKSTDADLDKLDKRLDEIENRMITASAAIVQVNFPTGSAAFKPSAQVAKVLIAAGKAADKVNVRGRTDATVAGPMDVKLALARALSARRFLVDHGVSADKIRVFSLAEGAFMAPDTTLEGKALNRRVEVEFINQRIAALKSQSIKLASAQ